jgi:uncharacterized protein YgiM (DUF1202 family)
MTAIAHIITDSIYVREKPHKDAVEIGALKKGDKVAILDTKTFAGGYTWVQVRLKKGGTGWIYASAEYVKVVSNVPDFEPVEIPIPDTSLAKLFAWVVGIIAACSALAYCVR